jgi:hypothetical protein
MTEDQDWCTCPACQRLQTINAMVQQQLGAMQAGAFRVIPAWYPWPPQRRGACQSQARVDALWDLTAPVRGRGPQEESDGPTAHPPAPAGRVVQWYVNDHDDDDDLYDL